MRAVISTRSIRRFQFLFQLGQVRWDSAIRQLHGNSDGVTSEATEGLGVGGVILASLPFHPQSRDGRARNLLK